MPFAALRHGISQATMEFIAGSFYWGINASLLYGISQATMELQISPSMELLDLSIVESTLWPYLSGSCGVVGSDYNKFGERDDRRSNRRQ